VAKETTRPCEYCGVSVTKTATQQSQRKYWTCSPSCANKLRIQRGNTPSWGPNPLRGVKETRPCAQCGAPVTRYLSARIGAQVWTCSNQCQGTYNTARRMAAGLWVQPPPKPRRGETNPCETCGAPVYRNHSETTKGVRRYCSTACKNQAMTKPALITHCETCGVEVRRKPSQTAAKYCSRRCYSKGKATLTSVGREHNGKPVRRNSRGYLMVWDAAHPGGWSGWHLEHRYVVEKQLGRKLVPTEQVDHINRDKEDNRPENLRVLSPGAHGKHSATSTWDDVRAARAELEAYRQRHGPLTEHD
jgi:endogenous inhibitor of DNA gyrase (YacG/DUF329 family)